MAFEHVVTGPYKTVMVSAISRQEPRSRVGGALLAAVMVLAAPPTLSAGSRVVSFTCHCADQAPIYTAVISSFGDAAQRNKAHRWLCVC